MRTINELSFPELIDAFQSTGRIAFFHPRKQQVSISGGRRLSVRDASIMMREVLNAAMCEVNWLEIAESYSEFFQPDLEAEEENA